MSNDDFTRILKLVSVALGLGMATWPAIAQAPSQSPPGAANNPAKPLPPGGANVGTSLNAATLRSFAAYSATLKNEVIQNSVIGAQINPAINLKGLLEGRGRAPAVIRCLGTDRSKDTLGVKTTSEGTLVQINCSDAWIDGKDTTGPQSVTFATASFGRGTLSSYYHLRGSSCANAFQTYKSDPKVIAFLAEKNGIRLDCRTESLPDLNFRQVQATLSATPSTYATNRGQPPGRPGPAPQSQPQQKNSGPGQPQATVAPPGQPGQAQPVRPNIGVTPGLTAQPAQPGAQLTAMAQAMSQTNPAFLGRRIETKIDGNIVNVEYQAPLFRGDFIDEVQIGLASAEQYKASHVLIQFFAAKPSGMATCENYEKAPGILGGSAAKTVRFAVASSTLDGKKELQAIAKAAGPNAPPQLASKAFITTFSLKGRDLDEIRKKLPAGDTSATIRVILGDLTLSKNGFPGFTCVAAISTTAEVLFGISPEQTAQQKLKEGIKDYADSEKKREDIIAGYIKELSGKSALNVQVIGYVPPFRRGEILISTEVPDPITSAKQKTYNLQTKNTGVYTANTKSTGFPWPKQYQKDWTASCRYSPALMSQAIHDYNWTKKQIPEGVFDRLVWTLDVIAVTYDGLKDLIVQSIAYVTTAGECPFTVKYSKTSAEVAAKQPKACQIYKTALGSGLNIALSYVGLPPSLPSASALLEEGASYAASYAVKYAFSKVAASETGSALIEAGQKTIGEEAFDKLSEDVREKIRSEIKSTIVGAVNARSCVQLAPEGSFQDYNKCLVSEGSILNYSKRDDDLMGRESHAVVWLRVTHNKSAARNLKGELLQPIVDVYVNSNITDFGTGQGQQNFDAWAKFWTEKATGKSVLDPTQLKLFSVGHARLDAKSIPDAGVDVPVIMPFADLQIWKWAAAKTNACSDQSLFYDSCLLGRAVDAQRVSVFQHGKTDLSVSTSFKAPVTDANVTAACQQSAALKSKLMMNDCNSANIGTTVANLPAATPSRTRPGLLAHVPVLSPQNSIPACPGFQMVTNPVDGLADIALSFNPTSKDIEFTVEP